MIEKIYENTVPMLEEIFGKNIEIKEKYRTYLEHKYKNKIKKTEMKEFMEMLVDLYSSDEEILLKTREKDEILSMIEEDSPFEHLQFLHEIIMDDDFMKEKTREECGKLLGELEACAASVKAFNLGKVMELMSESKERIE